MDYTLVLKDVTKVLAHREAIRNVSFLIEKGDIFGYLGSNGAGKTTSIRIILDLLKPTSGEVIVLGDKADSKIIRNRIGFMLDADGLYNNLSAIENLEFYSKIYGLYRNTERIKSILDMVGLKNRGSDKAATFSKGMRQRLSLGRALVHNPEILVLDEPMSGIDPEGRIEFRKLMLEVAKSQNKTIFLSSHNLDEIQRLCNRIAIIDKGEIKLKGDLKSLQKGSEKGEIIVSVIGDVKNSLIEEIKNNEQLGFVKYDDHTFVFEPKGRDASDIIAFLSERGVKIESVRKKEVTLEEIYSSIIGKAE